MNPVCSQFFFFFAFLLEVVHPKTDQQRTRLNEAVKSILLFKNLERVSFTCCELIFQKKTVVLIIIVIAAKNVEVKKVNERKFV